LGATASTVETDVGSESRDGRAFVLEIGLFWRSNSTKWLVSLEQAVDEAIARIKQILSE
jgi:hypothetical protein